MATAWLVFSTLCDGWKTECIEIVFVYFWSDFWLSEADLEFVVFNGADGLFLVSGDVCTAGLVLLVFEVGGSGCTEEAGVFNLSALILAGGWVEAGWVFGCGGTFGPLFPEAGDFRLSIGFLVFTDIPDLVWPIVDDPLWCEINGWLAELTLEFAELAAVGSARLVSDCGLAGCSVTVEDDCRIAADVVALTANTLLVLLLGTDVAAGTELVIVDTVGAGVNGPAVVVAPVSPAMLSPVTLDNTVVAEVGAGAGVDWLDAKLYVGTLLVAAAESDAVVLTDAELLIELANSFNESAIADSSALLNSSACKTLLDEVIWVAVSLVAWPGVRSGWL